MQRDPHKKLASLPEKKNVSFTGETPEQILSEFGKNMRDVIQLLEEDYPLGVIEQVCIENYMHIFQMAYRTWQRRALKASLTGLDKTC